MRRLSSPSAAPTECDIVIVGGGPAGLALAGALATIKDVRETTKITLIEAGDLSTIRAWTQPEGTWSNRVSSITNSSQSFLEEIGAWAHVETSRTTPLEDMQVWDGISDARIQFSAQGIGSSRPASDQPGQLAHMTENLNIQRALLRLLDQHPTVQLLDKVKVDIIIQDPRDKGAWPVVKLSNGQELRTRLLIGADGFNSPVKKFAGIQSYGWAYDTHAIVATMNHHPAYPGTPKTAYQRFLPTGPIAFLPLSDIASSLVWSTKPALATALKSAPPDVLRQMINAAFRLPDISLKILNDILTSPGAISSDEIADTIRWRESSHGIAPMSAFSSAELMEGAASVGGYGSEADLPPLVTSVQPGSVAGFPLRMSHADVYLGEGEGARTALVGDAAHTVHPLAGQGLNMGLADVEVLAGCISEAIRVGTDIGSRTALSPYPRARYLQNHGLISATDKLHKLYSSTWSPLVWARSVGLEVINELDTVKTALMMNAGSKTKTFGGGGSAFNSGSNPLWGAAASAAEFASHVADSTKTVAQTTSDLGSNVLKGMYRR
ncbi:putative ubiquinone biosynthesis monooxygenase [Tulasnella sp. 330]|nr:putative ubiquinone biosynthesis monooxygenase [Tulasnella sp. 330]KAG8872648.1 putative ubiquinone biosynthesis monooxygenase [Tulasnella sp. 331]KAG8876109.1 putative ubiquinone biosynthesis monooxygenase [Tulasnella sp. 332]